jgi:hypothetical protein
MQVPKTSTCQECNSIDVNFLCEIHKKLSGFDISLVGLCSKCQAEFFTIWGSCVEKYKIRKCIIELREKAMDQLGIRAIE